MSTPTFGSNPLPETNIWLVGGPVFLESVIEGAARHTVENIKHAANQKTQGRKEAEVAVGELADALMEMPPSDRDIVARKRGPDVTLRPSQFPRSGHYTQVPSARP